LIKERKPFDDENDADGFFCGMCVAPRKRKEINKAKPEKKDEKVEKAKSADVKADNFFGEKDYQRNE